MTTGIVRRLDDLGRIVIPKEIRRQCGLGEGDPLEIEIEDGRIVLTPYRPQAKDKIYAGLESLADWCESIEDYKRANTLRKMRREMEREEDQK